MNNWDALIRLIVPLSFMAIWALTSLFNRESRVKPGTRPTPLRPNPGPMTGPRSGEPTLRWNTPMAPNRSTNPPGRTPIRVGGDDGIVILSSENMRNERETGGRTVLGLGGKRPTKGKPVVPPRKAEPSPPRSKLAGVSQNVNQHLTNTNLELTPLMAMPPGSAMPSLGLSSLPTATPDMIGAIPRTATAIALNDPKKLREALLLNEILSPPVSMRNRRIGPAPHASQG